MVNTLVKMQVKTVVKMQVKTVMKPGAKSRGEDEVNKFYDKKP